MIKRLLVIILIDLAVIWIWVKSIHPDPGISIALLYYIPVLVVTHIIAGVVLKICKNVWANPVLINAILSAAIFYFFFTLAIQLQVNSISKNFYFKRNDSIFQISLSLNPLEPEDSLRYQFYRFGEGTSRTIGVDGHYYANNDTLFLSTKQGRVMKIYNFHLFDYPKKGEIIRLRSERVILYEKL